MLTQNEIKNIQPNSCNNVTNDGQNDFSNISGHILIKLKTQKRKLLSFIDSGSDVSLVKKNIAHKIMIEQKLTLRSSDIKVESVNSSPVTIDGYINIPFTFGKKKYYHKFFVADGVEFTGAILIGSDFLHKCDAKIQCGNVKKVTLYGKVFKYTLLPHFSDYSSIKATKTVNCVKSNRVNYVKVVGNITVPPNSIVRIPVMVHNLPNILTNFLIEDFDEIDAFKVARSICLLKNKSRFMIECANASNDNVKFSNGDNVATALAVDLLEDNTPEIMPSEIHDQISNLDLSHLNSNEGNKLKVIINE